MKNSEDSVGNYRSKPMQFEAALVLPIGWKASPESGHLTIAPSGDGAAGFTVTIAADRDHSGPRVVLAADVVAGANILAKSPRAW